MTMQDEMMQQQVAAWADVKESQKTGKVLYARVIGIEMFANGKVKEECLKLDYQGIQGYLPRTFIDRYQFKGLQNFLGAAFEFVVQETFLDDQMFLANRIKALDTLAKDFWKQVEVGQKYECFVRSADKYNVYALVEGVPVKIHRDEYSHTFHDDLREVVEMGDLFEVVVTEFTKPKGEEEGKVLVSRKALEVDPMSFINEYKEKSFYLGRIIKIHAEYGLFVKLQPRGITVRCNFPPHADGRVLKVGEEVNVKIQEIDVQKRRVKGLIILPKSLKSRMEQPVSGRMNAIKRSLV